MSQLLIIAPYYSFPITVELSPCLSARAHCPMGTFIHHDRPFRSSGRLIFFSVAVAPKTDKIRTSIEAAGNLTIFRNQALLINLYRLRRLGLETQ